MPDCEIKIDKDYEGPSVLELVDSLDGIQDPIKISWSNSKNEVALLHKYPQKKFILYVNDFSTRDRTVATLGLSLNLEQVTLARTKEVIIDMKTYDWRNFCREQINGVAPKWLLLKLAADSLRKGNSPALADIIEPLLLRGVNIADADVLLRLKSKVWR